MANWPPAELCVPLPDPSTIDDICLPGGLCLSYIRDGIGKIPGAADLPMDFFSQIGPALAPMKPLFDILDTVLAIYRCVKAIPDAITSLDPSELLNCIPALAKLVDALLKLIPQMSIPKMIKSALRQLSMLLRGVATDFGSLQTQLNRIATLIDRAATLNDVKLNGYLVCAQQNVTQTALSTSEALKGIGRIILLINIFMGMIGGQEIPCFGTLIEDNLSGGFETLIEILTSLADILDQMADAIPDPDLILTLALGEQRC